MKFTDTFFGATIRKELYRDKFIAMNTDIPDAEEIVNVLLATRPMLGTVNSEYDGVQKFQFLCHAISEYAIRNPRSHGIKATSDHISRNLINNFTFHGLIIDLSESVRVEYIEYASFDHNEIYEMKLSWIDEMISHLSKK